MTSLLLVIPSKRCLQYTLSIHFSNPNSIFGGSHCLFILLAPWDDRPGYFSRCFQFAFCCHVYQSYVHLYLCSAYTHTYTFTHTVSLTKRYNFAASKLLWHIEVIRTDIIFCKLLPYSQTSELHFSKLQKSWKRSKLLNNPDYTLLLHSKYDGMLWSY